MNGQNNKPATGQLVSDDSVATNIDALIEQSSFGTDAARSLRSRAAPTAVAKTLQRAQDLAAAATRQNETLELIGDDAIRTVRDRPHQESRHEWEPSANDSIREWPRGTLLGRLPPPSRRAVLTAGVEVEQPGGQRIIREGDQEDHVFLLVNGLVKVTASTEDGSEALLGIRAGGDLIGEIGVLERIPRSATVTTCAPLVTRVLYRNQLMDLMTLYPQIAVEIASMISWRLRWANRRRIEFAGNNPRTRVSRVILELASLYGRDNGSSWTLGVPLKQAEIASLASIKQRTVEKELHRLQEERIVDCRYRRIEVIDMDALRSIADEVSIPHEGGVS